MKELLFVAAPKIVAGVGGLVVNVILLRFLGPDDFGAYSLSLAAIFLGDASIGAAVDLGVIRLATVYRRVDPARRLAVERTAFWLKLVVALGASVFLVLLAGSMTRNLFHSQSAARLVYLAAGGAVATLAFRSAQVHFQVNEAFGLYGALDLLQSVVKFAGVAILIVLGRPTPDSILACFVAGPAVAFLVFALAHARQLAQPLMPSRAALLELLRVVKWFGLTFGLGALLSRTDMILLSLWSTLAEVGRFGAGYTLVTVFDLLGAYVAVVLSPRIMPLWQEGRFARFYYRFQIATWSGCAVLYVIALAAMRWLGPLLLPVSFASGADIFVALLPGALVALASFPLTINFLLFVRPSFLFKLDCLAAPAVLLLYAYAIPRYGALGAAWVTSATRALRLAIAQVVAWQSAGEGVASAAAPATAGRPAFEFGGLP